MLLQEHVVLGLRPVEVGDGLDDPTALQDDRAGLEVELRDHHADPERARAGVVRDQAVQLLACLAPRGQRLIGLAGGALGAPDQLDRLGHPALVVGGHPAGDQGQLVIVALHLGTEPGHEIEPTDRRELLLDVREHVVDQPLGGDLPRRRDLLLVARVIALGDDPVDRERAAERDHGDRVAEIVTAARCRRTNRPSRCGAV